MQISRMPIPADDCTNSEMSVEANPSDTKSDLETSSKVNGDDHKTLNGNSVDCVKEADETPETIVKEEKNEDQELKSKTESLSETTSETIETPKNGELEDQEPEKNEEEPNKETNVEEDTPKEVKIEPKVEPKDNEIQIDETTPMEVDETENQLNDDTVTIKKEPEEVEETKSSVVEETVVVETEKLPVTEEVNNDIVITKINIEKKNTVNGDARTSDEEKTTSKDEKVIEKIPLEEDLCSEISTDTPSPKQV